MQFNNRFSTFWPIVVTRPPTPMWFNSHQNKNALQSITLNNNYKAIISIEKLNGLKIHIELYCICSFDRFRNKLLHSRIFQSFIYFYFLLFIDERRLLAKMNDLEFNWIERRRNYRHLARTNEKKTQMLGTLFYRLKFTIPSSSLCFFFISFMWNVNENNMG